MDTTSKVVLISFVILISMVTSGFINGFYVYEAYGYPIDQIIAHLNLALDTHNVDAKVKYIDDTVLSLEDWHGNGEWWFPKDGTDIDQTRELLRTVSEDMYQQIGVKERDGYMILPHNELIVYLNSEIDKSVERLDDYEWALKFNPHNNLFHYIWGPILITSFIIFAITGMAKMD